MREARTEKDNSHDNRRNERRAANWLAERGARFEEGHESVPEIDGLAAIRYPRFRSG